MSEIKNKNLAEWIKERSYDIDPTYAEIARLTWIECCRCNQPDNTLVEERDILKSNLQLEMNISDALRAENYKLRDGVKVSELEKELAELKKLTESQDRAIHLSATALIAKAKELAALQSNHDKEMEDQNRCWSETYKELEKELNELKAKIDGGIRVEAFKQPCGDYHCLHKGDAVPDATLFLDNPGEQL